MQAIKGTFEKLNTLSTSSSFPFPWWMGLIIIVVFFIMFGVYMANMRKFQTPENLRRQLESLYKDKPIDAIIKQEPNRKTYSQFLASKGSIDVKEFILGNLQFLTASTAGFFFTGKGAEDGVFSPEAAKYAARAGARAFVFEIWPSMDPLTPHEPVLQVVQEGSNWRRISFNSMCLSTAIEPIINAIYASSISTSDNTRNPQDDVVIFYLRFRGQPKRITFDKTAKILEKFIEPYRLDISFNSNRKRNYIASLGLNEIKGKIIVCTNTVINDNKYNRPGKTNDISPLYEYINYGPRDYQEVIEYTTIPAVDDKSVSKSIFSFAVLNPESADNSIVKSNDVLVSNKRAHTIGINCVAVDIFNPITNSIGSNAKFASESYAILESGRMSSMMTDTTASPVDYGIRDGKINI